MAAPFKTCLLAAVSVLAPGSAARADAPVEAAREFVHSVDVSPISPFIGIYAVQYSYEFSPKNELIVGPAYMNIRYDFGETNAPAVIVGYRRYFWRTLHLEYQLWPTYDRFYESIEKKHYESFDLWNEARLGYRFDIAAGPVDLYLNVQWAFGFGLYASNKPASFKKAEKESPFFTAPLVFTGVRF